MADLSITFTNLSTAAFKRSAYGREESVVDTDAQLPDEKMAAGQIQVLAVNNQTAAGEGAATFWCCWIHEETSAPFGVKIHDAGQPFGMGWQPAWQVMADRGPATAEPHWKDNGPSPANTLPLGAAVNSRTNTTRTASQTRCR